MNARARTTGTNGGSSNAHGNGHQGNQHGVEESAMTLAQRSAAGNSTETSTAAATSTCPAALINYRICQHRHHIRTVCSHDGSCTSIGGIDPNWILFDSLSTISVIQNASMLQNIRNGLHVLRAITNGGHQDSNMIGNFPNLGPVWYNKNSIANIMLLSEVRKVCTVTMDTSKEPAINVHRKDGFIMSFVEFPSDHYVCHGNSNSDSVSAHTLFFTIAEHREMFSRTRLTLLVHSTER